VVVEENRLGFGFQGGVSTRADLTSLTGWEGREGRENALYHALLPFPLLICMDDFVHGASQLFFLNGCSYLTLFSDELRVPHACYEPEWVGRLVCRRRHTRFHYFPLLVWLWLQSFVCD